tara:strand:+ start:235 stop:522 length:288 start_codon:yes stop_codon:yes gene_type:complete
MKNIFELSEAPTVENTSSIINEGMKIKVARPSNATSATRVLKIMLGGIPFYHFSNKEFDGELATRQQDVIVDGKRFYMGLKNNSMRSRMKLTPAN